MTLESFEQEIIDAIMELPKHLREKIENVGFVIEEEVRPAALQELKINYQGTLLGLYQGVPLAKRGVNYFLVLPDKITIFKKPIENLAGNDKEMIKKIIHDVVHHEIAHYFGMSETEVRNWEKKRQSKK